MSVGPLGGMAASIAGSQLAQTKGSDLERSQNEANSQQRSVQGEKKAEDAAGIGATDGEDHETAERDADGRRIWEDTRRRKPGSNPPAAEAPPSRDATGQSGTLLDLIG